MTDEDAAGLVQVSFIYSSWFILVELIIIQLKTIELEVLGGGVLLEVC